MKKWLNLVLVSVVLLLLIGSSFPLVDEPESVGVEEKQYLESIMDFLSMSPDPHLDQAPNVVINGTSGEFDSSFHSSVNETDPSYIELNWTHVQDTPLQFRPDEGISECADFVYFTQEVDWPYNELPLHAELRFNLSAVFTGDFGTDDDGRLMFNVRTWLIDSSGNWILVYQTNPPYGDFFWQRGAELDYSEIVGAWRGMISNSTHPQEDPEDTLTLAIGLSPNSNFQSFESSEPWRYYDGSVYVRVSDVDLYVRMELPPDPSTHLAHLFNNSWGMAINEVFPFHGGEADDICYDVEAGEDGAVYVVGRTYTGYEYYISTRNRFSSGVLLKYDSELNLLWKQKNVNNSRHYALDVHRGNIYTAGCIRVETTEPQYNWDSYVTKWGPGGNRIWSRQWGGSNEQEGVAVAAGADSSVYVLVSDFNRHDPTHSYYQQSALLKYNSAGNLVWNKTLDRALYTPHGDIFVTGNKVILSDGGGFFSVRDVDGNEQWNMTYSGDMAVDTDHIYVSRLEDIQTTVLHIEKWTLNGTNIWNTSYSYQFVNGVFDNIPCAELGVDPDGSVYALTQGYFLHGFMLTKVNNDGSLNWTKTIGTSDWPLGGGWMPTMTVSSWGIAYFAMSIDDDFHTFAHQIGEYTLPKPPLTLPVPLILGVGGAVAVVAAIVWLRRRKGL